MSKELIKLCVDTYKGNVQNYSNKQSSDVIRNAFVDIMGSEHPSPYDFERHKIDLYEILTETLDQLIVDGWENNDFFQQFVEYKDVPAGDKNEFYVEDRSLLTVSKIAGGHWDIERQRLNNGQTFQVKTDFYGVAIYDDFFRFVTGRIDWDNFVNRLRSSLNNKLNEEIYTSFMDTITYLPTEFKANATFDKNTMLTIVDHVTAASGNPATMIAGTRTALGNLVGSIDAGWVSEEMKKQRNTTGMVRYWEGIPLLEIPQVHKANTFDFAISNKRLMILPAGKPIKLVREGESYIKETTDNRTNMDMSIEHMFLTKFGVATVFNQMFGMYELG